MQKGKVFVTLWKELKVHKELTILVHAEDVNRFRTNITKNKLRDVGYNIQFPSARLSYYYNREFSTLRVSLSVTQLDCIPLNKL